MYEIDCSINDIDDYIHRLFSNESNLKKHFDSSYGGEIGQIHEIFSNNLRTVREVAKDSKALMYDDISLAWQVRDYNQKVIEELKIKVQQIEHQISRQIECVAAAQRNLANAERAESQIRSRSTPSFPDTEEGRTAKRRFEKEQAAAKANAANAVRSASNNVSNAQNLLKSLENSKQNVCNCIVQIENNNKVLFEFINKINAKIGEIDSYLTRCESEFYSVKSCLEKLEAERQKLLSKFSEYKARAERAKEYVHSIGTHLSAASGTQYNESNRISVRSHDYLSDIATSLISTKKSMDELNDTIDRIVKRFGNIIQDALTRTTVASVEGCNQRIESGISDFTQKAKHFREAADYLYSYTHI